jgi:flagellar biosynthesis/type III secretory pathway chaperone
MEPMTQAAVLETADSVDQALVLVERLEALLEQEFEALKVQDLDQFDVLLSEKNHILAELSRLTGVKQPEDADKLGVHWNDFRSRMMACRDMHRRNEILIMRKLDAIRGALESLNVNDPTSPVEVYDRLGQIKRLRRMRGFTEA